jgi:hypothetical protein
LTPDQQNKIILTKNGIVERINYKFLEDAMTESINELSVDDIKAVLLKLPRNLIIALDQDIHEYLEASNISKAAEESFLEWQDPEEDIYNVDL